MKKEVMNLEERGGFVRGFRGRTEKGEVHVHIQPRAWEEETP